MGTDPTSARAIVEEFLRRAEKPHGHLTDELSLWGSGLGLDSLEAAELSSMLEDAFGTDPFSAGGDMPETVGDVVAFYEGVHSE